MRERGSGDFSRFSWHFVRFKSCDTCLCACAFQQRARDRETAHCVVPRGRGLVAVTREFERDNCVTSEILQSDWTIPNRAGVPRKSTKVPRPSFVRESREGLGPRLVSRGGRTLRNRTQCLMNQQFLLRRECMDKSKSLLQQNQMEIGEVMLLPGCTLTETYRILTDPRRSPTFQRVIAKSTRTSAACATCTQ